MRKTYTLIMGWTQTVSSTRYARSWAWSLRPTKAGTTNKKGGIALNATPKDIMTAKLLLNAVFPVMQVLLDDDPKLHAAFQNVTAVVQFGAKNGDSMLACHLLFNCGQV